MGTSGPDVIGGTAGSDEIRALGGDDRVCGRGGADSISGGGGQEEVVDHLNDVDVAFGSLFDDVLHGDDGSNQLNGQRIP